MTKQLTVRTVSFFIVFFVLIGLFSVTLSAQKAPPPSAEHVDAFCVISADYNEVIIEKNMKKVIYPASTAKLMTALIAEEHFSGNLETPITVTAEMIKAVTGRNMGLAVGERIRVIDLLHALLVSGYNDAAIVLALATSDSIDSFATKMNEKAKSLGANETVYTNPTGLHDSAMITTAYDTALIGLAVMKNETLFAISKTLTYKIPATNKSEYRTIHNRNPLLNSGMTKEYYSNARGMSAGATDEGGDCVVTSGSIKSSLGSKIDALPNELSFVCVAMGGRAPSAGDETNYACVTAKEALYHTLYHYDLMQLLSEKQDMGSLPIRFSPTEESVNLKPREDLYAVLHSEIQKEDLEIQVNVESEQLDAPIHKDTSVGTIRVLYNGKVLAQTELVTTKDIDSHGFLIFMYRLKQITQHPVFIILLILAVGGIVYLLLKRFPLNKNKDRHKRNRYF